MRSLASMTSRWLPSISSGRASVDTLRADRPAACCCLELVVSDGQEGAAQGVEVGNSRRVGVGSGFRGGSLVPVGRARRPDVARARWAGSPRSAGGGRNRPTSGSVLGSATSTVSLTSQVSCRHGSKTHLLPGVVGVQGGDDALDGVVEQHRADADADVELEAVGGGEERLVLADRLALVVEDGPAAAHPARTDIVGVISGWPSAPTMILPAASRLGTGPARPGSSSGSRGRSRRSRRS